MNVQNIEERRKICESCPIYNPVSGTCNSKLWINPNNNEVSSVAKSGFVRGCGCFISTKIKGTSNHCIAGKW